MLWDSRYLDLASNPAQKDCLMGTREQHSQVESSFGTTTRHLKSAHLHWGRRQQGDWVRWMSTLLRLWSWKVLAGRVGFRRVVHSSCVGLHFESTALARVLISQSRGITHLPQGYRLLVLSAAFKGFSVYKGRMFSASIILIFVSISQHWLYSIHMLLSLCLAQHTQ